MRIGHFVPVVSRLRGYERNVSGHIQIPLRTMELLALRGHEVHLITNEFGEDRVMPWCMPKDVPVHYVLDSRRRLGSLEKKRPQASGVYPLAFLRQVRQIKKIARQHQFDVLHLHGHDRTVQLGGILRLARLGIPTVASAFGPLASGSRSRGFLIRRAGPIMTATEYVAKSIRSYGADAHVLRHGLVRDLREELDSQEPMSRHRVLFWRDLTLQQGGDVAMQAFDALAPEFPQVQFDFAVRPNPRELKGADELAQKHSNVNVFRFPYPPGVSLAGLLSESICAVMPFTGFSMHPQLAIAETMAMGVPVIATDIESAGEVVSDGRTGLLIPVGDAGALTRALREVLADPAGAAQMGERAAAEIARKWDWAAYLDGLTGLYQQLLTGRNVGP